MDLVLKLDSEDRIPFCQKYLKQHATTNAALSISVMLCCVIRLNTQWRGVSTLGQRSLFAGLSGSFQLVCFLENCCGASRNNKVMHSDKLSTLAWVVCQEFLPVLFLMSRPRVTY